MSSLPHVSLSLTTVSEFVSSQHSPRRRRADAERSIAAILEAAARVLGERPEASIEDVARAAGVSRQTVYAHFPSRDALLGALLDRVTERVVAAIDAADLDAGPPAQALVRFLEIGWQALEGDPFLPRLPTPPMSRQQALDRHEPVLDRLKALVTRGQRTGDFNRDLPASWLLSATVALGHAAGEEVRAGRMTAEDARDALRQSIRRLFGAHEPPTA